MKKKALKAGLAELRYRLTDVAGENANLVGENEIWRGEAERWERMAQRRIGRALALSAENAALKAGLDEVVVAFEARISQLRELTEDQRVEAATVIGQYALLVRSLTGKDGQPRRGDQVD